MSQSESDRLVYWPRISVMDFFNVYRVHANKLLSRLSVVGPWIE